MRLLLTILAACFIVGCNPVKKVFKNQKQFDQIGRAWAQKNPCVNDTTIVVRPGRVDTLTYTVPAADISQEAIDSVARALANKYNARLEECALQVNEAYRSGYKTAGDECKIDVVTAAPDTIKYYVSDRRKENILQGEKEEISRQLTDALKDAMRYKQQRNTAYIILGVIALSIGLFVWFNPGPLKKLMKQ